VHDGCVEWWSAEPNVGITCESKPLFRDSEETSIELVVPVLVVDRNYAVVAGRKIVHDSRCLTCPSWNGSGPMMHRFAHVLGPAIARFEDCYSNHSRRIAKSVGMNSQCAASGAGRRLRGGNDRRGGSASFPNGHGRSAQKQQDFWEVHCER
jgi:hypothetical protein